MLKLLETNPPLLTSLAFTQKGKPSTSSSNQPPSFLSPSSFFTSFNKPKTSFMYLFPPYPLNGNTHQITLEQLPSLISDSSTSISTFSWLGAFG
jgi:hypothetical protein